MLSPKRFAYVNQSGVFIFDIPDIAHWRASEIAVHPLTTFLNPFRHYIEPHNYPTSGSPLQYMLKGTTRVHVTIWADHKARTLDLPAYADLSHPNDVQYMDEEACVHFLRPVLGVTLGFLHCNERCDTFSITFAGPGTCSGRTRLGRKNNSIVTAGQVTCHREKGTAREHDEYILYQWAAVDDVSGRIGWLYEDMQANEARCLYLRIFDLLGSTVDRSFTGRNLIYQ